MEMKDQSVIVSGAGQGIGEATARTFAEAGAKVVVVDMNPATGSSTADGIKRGMDGAKGIIRTEGGEA